MHHMLFPPFLPVPTILDRHPINLINLPKHKPIAFAEQSTAHLFVRQYSMRQSGGAYTTWLMRMFVLMPYKSKT